MLETFEPQYLGDGVYASFDGYQVWLHVGSHDAAPVVALEPELITAINTYWAYIQAKYCSPKGIADAG